MNRILREAWRSACAQPVASIGIAIMSIAAIVTVMLTTGRAVGAERDVLESIDSAGTRTILVKADASAGIHSSVVDRIATITDVETVTALSSATDVTNSLFTDGARVPLRYLYSSDAEHFGIPEFAIGTSGAWASRAGTDLLGMVDGVGGVSFASGQSMAVVGGLNVPPEFTSLEPLVVAPRVDDFSDVSVIVVTAIAPDKVAAVSDAILSVLAVTDLSAVSIQTSETLATVRGIVKGQLGAFSSGLILTTLLLMILIVAAIRTGLIILRRRDFGRRRALGATRSLVVQLILSQAAILSASGVLVGIPVSVLILILNGNPLPGWDFMVAVGVLIALATQVATIMPALIASRRDPLRELRVP